MNSRIFHHLLFLLLVFAASAYSADDLFTTDDNTSGAIDIFGATDNEFLKVEDAYQVTPSIKDGQLILDWQIAPGYYLYKHRFTFFSTDNLQPVKTSTTFPLGKKLFDEYYQKELEVFYLQARISTPMETLPDSLIIESQGCADAGLCYPPRRQLLKLDQTNGLVSVSAFTGPAEQTAKPEPLSANNLPLIVVLLSALLGGLILNLMPCVFPVLSIKALSLTSSHLSAHNKHLHGLSYTLGIILSFVIIAAALLSLRASGEALGWGFQLQSPLFVGALVYLFVLMGLSFSGFFHFGTRLMNLGQSATQGSSLQSSFMTGVLATVVASPCTAPFMGSALGIALTQPSAVSLLIFTALGLGMALPFLILSWWPGLSKWMPRPGAWMETFKQFLAFPLYLSAAWLLWVLGRQTGINTVTAVIVGVILLCFAIWVSHNGNRRHPVRLTLSCTALLLSITIPLSALHNRDKPQTWEVFSTQRLTELRSTNQPVFVNLTADWCITCLANETTTLNSNAVKTAFSEHGVHYLKGDWTNYDTNITQFLTRHGRSGVPLYLFYGENNETPRILPQLLTKKIIINAITEK